MADKEYIERNALMEQVKAIHRAVNTSDINISYDTGFHSATSQIQGLIAWMPAANAVEVVRCKECKHYETSDWDGEILCGCNHPSGLKDVEPNAHCSYGERKEDENL